MKGFAENKMFVPPEFVREPIVIYNTNTATVYISTDGFETYSSMVLSGYGSLSTLMNGVLFIVSSNKSDSRTALLRAVQLSLLSNKL